jgi:hypothetical protein
MVDTLATSLRSKLVDSLDRQVLDTRHLRPAGERQTTAVSTSVEAMAETLCPSGITIGTMQTADPETCRPEVKIYSLPCDPRTVACVLFRKRQFLAARQRLQRLQGAVPPASDPRGRTRWCMDVCRDLAQLFDATNVPAPFLDSVWIDPDYEAPASMSGKTLFPTVAAFMDSMVGHVARATGLGPSQVGPIATPIVPQLGGPVTAHTRQQRPAIGRFALNDSWYVRTGGRTGVSAGYAPLRKTRAVSIPVRRTKGDRFVEDPNLTIEALLEAIFEITPGFTLDDAAYMYIESRGDETIFGTVGETDHEWKWGYTLGGEAIVRYLQAWITDCLARTLGEFSLVGLAEWIRHLWPYQATGRLNVTPGQLTEVYQSVSRAKTREGAAAIATGAAMINPVLGAIVAVVLELYAGFAPMAAGWSCPKAPFKRSVAEGACAVRAVQGAGEVDRILTEAIPSLVEAGAPAEMLLVVPPPPQEGEQTPGVPPFIPHDLPSSPAPIPWGNVLLAAGGTVGIIALVRYLGR